VKSNMMNRMTAKRRYGWLKVIAVLSAVMVGALAQAADIDAVEIFCTIRDSGNHLNCQWVGKDQRRSMSPEETAIFIDKSQVASYISVRSRKGMERVFAIDPESPQFRKLNEVIKTGAMSEIAKAKLDLFSEIERKAVKISDDLDAASVTMELVKYDDSIAVDKYKRELRRMDKDLVSLKDSGTENKSFDEGPNSVDQNNNQGLNADAFDAKYSAQLGFGMGINTVQSGANQMPAALATWDLAWRANWDFRWLTYTEIEARIGASPVTTYLSSATTSRSSANVYNANLKDGKCWGPYCAEIDVAQYQFIGLGAKANTGVFDSYADIFYGVSLVHREKMKNGLLICRLGYLVGSGTPNMDNKSVTNETMIVGTVNYERHLFGNHGFGAQGGIEYITANTATGSATTQNALFTNSDIIANAYYKYSF